MARDIRTGPTARQHRSAMLKLAIVCAFICGSVYAGQWWMTETNGTVDNKSSMTEPSSS